MRIRNQPAIAFGVLLLLSAYLGLSKPTFEAPHQSDKALHFITLFLLTASFYWILDTNKRKNLQLTILICTLGIGIGSEVVQGILPNDRLFDIFDIAANLAGSGAAIAACLWYHKRMIERKRRNRSLSTGNVDDDLELGEQETGVERDATLEEEVDNWDENEQDWDDDDPTATETASGEETIPPKKRDD